jgi:hypothetical protein
VQYSESVQRFKEVKAIFQNLGEYQFSFVNQRLDKNACHGLQKVGVYDCFGKKLHLILRFVFQGESNRLEFVIERISILFCRSTTRQNCHGS